MDHFLVVSGQILKVFWHGLMAEQNAGEKVEAYLGYRGEKLHINEANFSSVRVEIGRNIWHMHNMRQSTRDSSNGTVYTEFFWHNLSKHGPVF